MATCVILSLTQTILIHDSLKDSDLRQLRVWLGELTSRPNSWQALAMFMVSLCMTFANDILSSDVHYARLVFQVAYCIHVKRLVFVLESVRAKI